MPCHARYPAYGLRLAAYYAIGYGYSMYGLSRLHKLVGSHYLMQPAIGVPFGAEALYDQHKGHRAVFGFGAEC